MSGRNDRGAELIRAANAAADNEAALFRLILDAEDEDGLDGAAQKRVIDHIGEQIDALRRRRGLGPDPKIGELMRHYDGTPMVPLEELEREYPGARITQATRVELVGDRMRAFPVVRVHLGDEEFAFLPEPSAQERARARAKRRGNVSEARSRGEL